MAESNNFFIDLLFTELFAFHFQTSLVLAFMFQLNGRACFLTATHSMSSLVTSAFEIPSSMCCSEQKAEMSNCGKQNFSHYHLS